LYVRPQVAQQLRDKSESETRTFDSRFSAGLPERVKGAHGWVVEATLDGKLGAVQSLQVGDIAHADAAHFIGGEELK
jgi:hypothetical protein